MPCDYSQYPDNWLTEIRPAILKRAEDCCENCGVKNHAVIRRSKHNGAIYRYWNRIDQRFDDGAFGLYVFDNGGEYEFDDPVTIILTIAHLDHDITNNHPDNLAALCQRCHLRHDAKLHARHAKECPGQVELFRQGQEAISPEGHNASY